MKTIKILSILCIISSNSLLHSMEQQAEMLASLSLLPPEIKIHIIPFLTSANSLDEAINSINNLSMVNKEFNNLIKQDKALAGTLIVALSKKFKNDYNKLLFKKYEPTLSEQELEKRTPNATYHESSLFAFMASRLNSPAAAEWFKEYLNKNPEAKKYPIIIIDQKLAKFLENNRIGKLEVKK